MTQHTTDFEKPVPYWVGLMVAVLLFGTMALVGGYWVWARLTQPGPGELVEVPAIPQARMGPSAPPVQQSGISKATGLGGQITYTIRAPESILTVAKSTAQPNWTYTFGYNRSDLMTPDQTAAATARYRLLGDPMYIRSLKVTDDQLAKLKAVPAVATMVVTEPDQALVKAAFAKYESQNNSANEQALVKLLGEIAARSLVPTRASIAQKVAQIQSILTEDQIKPFKPQ